MWRERRPFPASRAYLAPDPHFTSAVTAHVFIAASQPLSARAVSILLFRSSSELFPHHVVLDQRALVGTTRRVGTARIAVRATTRVNSLLHTCLSQHLIPLHSRPASIPFCMFSWTPVTFFLPSKTAHPSTPHEQGYVPLSSACKYLSAIISVSLLDVATRRLVYAL